jgi:hypothetical protein
MPCLFPESNESLVNRRVLPLRANGAGFALEAEGVTFYLNFAETKQLSDLARTLWPGQSTDRMPSPM